MTSEERNRLLDKVAEQFSRIVHGVRISARWYEDQLQEVIEAIKREEDSNAR